MLDKERTKDKVDNFAVQNWGAKKSNEFHLGFKIQFCTKAVLIYCDSVMFVCMESWVRSTFTILKVLREYRGVVRGSRGAIPP